MEIIKYDIGKNEILFLCNIIQLFTIITDVLIRYGFILKGVLYMKNVCKKLLTIITSLVLTMCVSVPTFATEVTKDANNNITDESTNEYGISTLSNSYTGSGVYVNSKSWKTIATSTTGFNCNVKISSLGTSVTTVDVRMLGKSGNVIWSESESFGSLTSRVYWCGSDVYKIQVKYHSGEGTITCYPTN